MFLLGMAGDRQPWKDSGFISSKSLPSQRQTQKTATQKQIGDEMGAG